MEIDVLHVISAYYVLLRPLCDDGVTNNCITEIITSRITVQLTMTCRKKSPAII